MDQIPGLVIALIALVIVSIVAALAQPKWRSKGLLWIWLASAVIITGTQWFWISYQHGFPHPSTRQEFFAVALVTAFLFVMVALASGMAVWFGAILGSRSQQASSEDIAATAAEAYELIIDPA